MKSLPEEAASLRNGLLLGPLLCSVWGGSSPWEVCPSTNAQQLGPLANYIPPQSRRSGQCIFMATTRSKMEPPPTS